MDSSKAGAYAGGIIGMLAGLLIGFSTDMSTTGITWLTTIFVVLGMGIGMHMQKMKKEEGSQELMKYITFEETKDNLWRANLLQRGPISASCMRVYNIPYINSTYHPEELHFGAVSVGGFTTGGVYKTDAYVTQRYEGKSGRGKIEVEIHGEKVFLHEIKLTKELVEQAKKDPFIKQFLAHDLLVLAYKDAKVSDALLKAHSYAMSEGKLTAANDISMRAYTDVQLRVSDCDKIIKWVSGVGDSSSNVAMTWKCDKCGRENSIYLRRCACARWREDLREENK